MARLRLFSLSFLLATLTCALLFPRSVLAQPSVRFAGSTAVGSTGPTQPVMLTVRRSATLGSVHVRTQGTEGYDFAQSAGGTCQTGLSYVPGQTCTVLVGFSPVAPGQRTGAVVLLDSSGVPMASTFLSAVSTGSLNVFVPGTINTVAGTGTWLYGGDGSPANQSAIFLPFGVAVDASGALLIADNSNNRIRRVDPVTHLMSTVAGNGILGFSGDGGRALDAHLSSPTSVLVDPAGNILFTDSGNNVVRRIDAFTGIISTIIGTPGRNGYSGDAGPATSALLNAPNGLALDASGNLFLADTGNHAIRRLDALTGILTTIAGKGTPGYTGDGGPALAALLNSPWGLTVSSSGEIYIADQGNHALRKIDAAGLLQTIAGTGKAGFNDDDIPASTAQLNSPAGVAVDVAGNIYIADSGNNRVRKINASTGLISSIAGNHGQAFFGDGGPADVAGLYGPYTLALDGAGDLFIADVFHNRIRGIAANSSTLVFPPMRVGRTSTPMGQKLENDGNAPLHIASLDPQTNSTLDPLATTCAPSIPLQPLDQCLVSVSFAPTMTGTLVTGSLLVRSDAGNAPATVNLNGQVLDVDPTTLTLTSGTNPSQTGTPVLFTVNASSDGITPTGTVTLLDGTTVLASTTLDQFGRATFTLSTLKSGQHQLTASYPGDTSNTPATSAVLVQVVKDPVAATSTTISSASNPATAGAGTRFTAVVQPQVAGSGTGDITGTVTFKDGSFTFGSAPIVNGSATLPLVLATGQHAVYAVYSGSSTYASSTSAALPVYANIAQSRLALSTSAQPSFAGAPLTLTATATSNGGTPIGSVTFLDGSVTLGSSSLNSSGLATLTVPGTAWTVGTHNLTASYPGDVNDEPSVSPVFPQVVNLAQTTVLLGSSANPIGLGGTVTFTASASGNGGTPSGSVQFFDGSVLLGSASLNASGAALFSTASLTLGAHTITAQYAGNAEDQPSNSAPLAQQVEAATIAVQFTTSANPSLLAAPLTLSATVNGSGSQPTGSVQFLDGTTAVGSAILDPSGTASLSVNSLSLGIHTLTASYPGDKNHAAVVSAPLSQHILQGTATTFTSSALHSIAGTSLQWTITVAGQNNGQNSGQSASQVPAGTVVITDGSAPLTTLTLDARGSATFSSSSLAPGSHTLVASYPGDLNEAPSTSAPLVETIDQAGTQTSLASSANPADSGTPVLLTASVSGSGGTPTGKLVFLDGSTVLASLPLQPNGTAVYSTSTLAPGVHALTATYSGDINDSASTSPILSQRIAQRTSITLTSSANPSLLGDSLSLSVQVGNGTTLAPSGTVTLTDGAATVASSTLNASGAVVFSIPVPSLGSHTYLATYAGDPQNLPAVSASLLQQVTLRPTVTAATVSSASISAGQTTVFVAIVQGLGSRPPTGTVTFASGSTLLGSGSVSSTGVVTVTLTPPQGSFNVVATYSGDTLFAASSSTPLSLIVGPTREFLLTTDPASLTLKSGGHTSMQLTLTSAATFADTLALGCAGLPAKSTCTFSDNQIKVGAGIPKTLTVTLDTGAPLGSGPTATLRNTGNPSAPSLCALPAGALLCLLFRCKRIRALLAVLLFLGTLTALTGCGNTFVQQATPAGAYTFQVVASGNQTGITQTTTVQLTVTP